MRGAEEKEALLNFVGQRCGVGIPGEVLSDLWTQELGAAHSLHSSTVDGQWRMLSSPEVNYNPLRLLHVNN